MLMPECIDDLLAREDPVCRDQTSEFDSIGKPAGVLCERTRGERPNREHAEPIFERRG
jgi:hypothetical protein